MSCNEYYGLKGVHRRRVITYATKLTDQPVHFSISCNHCANPVCISVCPENNYQKRWDGIVVHESNHCQGCMRCITACPFQAPKLNPRTNRADKCNFCVERIDQGLKPVCVENCVTGALSVMKFDANQINSFASQKTDIPIVTYTKPSIVVITKKSGQTFFREG